MRSLSARALLPAVVLLVGVVALSASEAGAGGRGVPPTYLAVNMASLGGASSAGTSINDFGLVAGYSNLAGDETVHAAAWLYGLTFDLGTLGGPNSAVLWPAKNDRGLIVGVAETAEADPLGEAWSCSNFFPGEPTGHVCRGFVWERGVMRPLPTLGGPHGFAAGANNLGQVVGWAENEVEDPTCVAPQVLQFRAVRWDTRDDTLEELPPLPGDTVSAATAINDRGQVVGISGICDRAVGRFSASHAVLWQDGEVIDIGNLGGVAWHTPMAINNHGEVVGFSNYDPADEGAFNSRAFYWSADTGIVDLGTLPGDSASQALGINDRGQVVGMSCTEGFASCRGFLWEDGVMLDLNALIGFGYDDHVYFANDINDRGMITGMAVDAGSGESVPFLALPFRGLTGLNGAQPITDANQLLPAGARDQLLRRLGLEQVESAHP